MNTRRLAAVLLAAILFLAACSGGGDASGVEAAPVDSPVAVVEVGDVTTDADRPGEEATDDERLSPLADQVRSVGSAIYDPEALLARVEPVPVSISIPELGIDRASVTAVGVDDGEMEIPGATEVGWYRHGPSPGRSGSAVLAAHIAYNGRDGVFRHLDSLRDGDRFLVAYDDGSQLEFVVVERAQYAKRELPVERVFRDDGEPVVTLITCGGDFNDRESSYRDNVVAYAIPV